MDKVKWETKLSTFEKYGRVLYITRLAWLLRLDNPCWTSTETRNLIEPEALLLQQIVFLGWEISEIEEAADHDIAKYRELKAEQLSLLKKFAAQERGLDNYEELNFDQLWVLAGPDIAAKLARHKYAQNRGELMPRATVKNLHGKRAGYFDIAKDLPLTFEDASFLVNNKRSKEPEKIVVDVDRETQLTIFLDVENWREVLVNLSKPLSDREIFNAVCEAVRKDTDKSGVIDYANELMNLTGVSNFKSLESSLSEGRKYYIN